MTEMTKAVCWELASRHATMLGMRVLLAGEFVGYQELSADNQRPRWKFAGYHNSTEASEAAVRLTEQFEQEWNAILIIPPGEVILHPSEMLAMRHAAPISPSLRARIFTSLQRRDPREGVVPSATAP